MLLKMSEQEEQTKQKLIKILLVEEDEMMRIFIRDIFWIHGREGRYQVELVQTLPEAEVMIADEETRPDVLFLDLMAPIKSGWASPSSSRIEQSAEFVRKLKSDPRSSSMKVVVFSWHKDSRMEKEFANLGVSGYLVKGELMPKEIIDFVENLVNAP